MLISRIPSSHSLLFVCNMELGQSTCFHLEENGFNNDPRHLKQDPSIPSSHGGPEPIRDRLWGHVTSDLWRGCRLVVDVATSGRAAALYVPAWLKHNHTLWTQSRPVWGREGRAQGGCRRPESRWRLRRHSMTDGHNTCTQAEKHRGMHTHMDTSTNTQWLCKQTYTQIHTQRRWAEDTKPAVGFVMFHHDPSLTLSFLV